MKENEAAGTIPEVFCNLAGPFSFLWAFVSFSGRRQACSVERRGEGAFVFLKPWRFVFLGLFFFGGSEASFPGRGPDGKLTIKFTCPSAKNAKSIKTLGFPLKELQ